MPAGPGMKIKTDTPLVKKAREGVMEFLLVCRGGCVQSNYCVLSTWGLIVFSTDQPPSGLSYL